MNKNQKNNIHKKNNEVLININWEDALVNKIIEL